MEIVTKLLGHFRIGITETHYGKILEEKVREEMARLSDRVKFSGASPRSILVEHVFKL